MMQLSVWDSTLELNVSAWCNYTKLDKMKDALEIAVVLTRYLITAKDVYIVDVIKSEHRISILWQKSSSAYYIHSISGSNTCSLWQQKLSIAYVS